MNNQIILMAHIVSGTNDFSGEQLEKLEGGETLQTGLKGRKDFIGAVTERHGKGKAGKWMSGFVWPGASLEGEPGLGGHREQGTWVCP